MGESNKCSPPPPPTRLRPRTTETVGETCPSHGYTPLPPPMQPEALMFVPRASNMSVHPYHFDLYAPGPSSSYIDHRMPTHSMHGSLPQYMSSPFTLPYYYNVSYSGDGSFMHLLDMPPHVHFAKPHTGSQYVGMVYSIGSRGESSEHKKENQSTC
ncbi:hypothetical protein Sjap_018223 [Stephania japonica]|uniref:Uncharacterized protein n=1 Tax=Stephania japonica TaxID=461633 RepID=A0AAP0I7T1_9MAGN